VDAHSSVVVTVCAIAGDSSKAINTASVLNLIAAGNWKTGLTTVAYETAMERPKSFVGLRTWDSNQLYNNLNKWIYKYNNALLNLLHIYYLWECVPLYNWEFSCLPCIFYD
jgi:hypothetical protein